MNKKFYFGLALTAGLFASCSSDDLVGESASSQAFIDNGAPAKIEIGLTPGYEITRGTGRVGDVLGAANAQWAGQEFNVLMLEKGTMMGARTTPNDPTTAIIKGAPFTATGTTVVALDNNAVFYPALKQDGVSTGVYDFWGYRLDGSEILNAGEVQFNGYDGAAAAAHTDAVEQTTMDATAYGALDAGVQGGDVDADGLIAATIQANDGKYYHNTTDGKYYKIVYTDATATATQITIPFEIDGTQDVMVATTSPSDAAYAAANPTAIYSAKSARNGVKPTMAFKHLLTSLTFKVKPKSKDISTAATNPTSPADPNWRAGYQITNITLKSKATGELIVAYTGDTEPAERIIWDAAQDWAAPATLSTFQLQCRNREVNDKADIEMVPVASNASITIDYPAGYEDKNGATSYTPGADLLTMEVYDDDQTDGTTGLPLGNKTTLNAMLNGGAGPVTGYIRTHKSGNRTPYETTQSYDECDYKATSLGVTSDLVPFVDNADVDPVILGWTYEAEEQTAMDATAYGALDAAVQGGDVDAAGLVAATVQANEGKYYHNTGDNKYYKIVDSGAAVSPVGEPMLVAPSNDVANSGYQVIVTYKYWKKQDASHVTEVTQPTQPIIVNNYTIQGGARQLGAFEAGKNYNVTITLYSDGEVLNGEATSEPWDNGGDLDAGDE